MQSWRATDDGQLAPLDGTRADLAAAGGAGGFVWVELDHPAAEDFAEAEAAFDLHPLTVAAALAARERPRIELDEHRHFVTLITLRPEDAHRPRSRGRVTAFVGRDFVLTVRQEDGDTLERARRRWADNAATVRGPLGVLLALLATVVEDHGVASERLENDIIASADRLFASAGSDEAFTLYGITLRLLAMTHAVQPLIEPLRHLSSAPAGMEMETARRFQDVLDQALVVEREISDDRELVEHLRDTNDSRIALQQNTDMRKISAWAAIIAIPTAVTGFYGMNVPYPGSGAVSGVITAVVLQAVLVVVLFAVFRRRGWL